MPEAAMTMADGRRVEDERFLRGSGRYTCDLDVPDALQAFVVRSPYAHASLARVDVDAALRCPGVAAVFTGRDLDSAGIGPLPCRAEIETSDGVPLLAPDWRLLAVDTVRYAGEGVALVVAQSLDAARDAAEVLDIDYRPLPAKAGSSNPYARCFDWEIGDAKATEAGFERAAHVTSMTLVNNRLIVNPLETRSALGIFDPDVARYTLYTPCQGVHLIRSMLAEPVLGIDLERLRVRTPDVGGGFGIKFAAYPEQGLVLFAARALGRPVRWVADRGESFLADAHARDHRSEASLALDAQGHILGLRISTLANLGAYLTGYGPNTATHGYAKMLGHVYRIPAAHLRVRGVLTHSAPVEAYRGAGTPEMVYVVERLVELAAEQMGIDRVEMRRRNLIAEHEMPYTNPSGRTCRDCDFPRLLDSALARSGWRDFHERRMQARVRGLRRGIGLSFYLHGTSAEGREHVEIRLDPSGQIEVRCGTQDSGQGHATSFSRLLGRRLGIDPSRIRVRQGDSDWLPGGVGTGGSSSLVVGSAAVLRAAEVFLDRARERAADGLEAAAIDLEYSAGRFRIGGTDRVMSLLDLARHLPAEAEGCAGRASAVHEDATFPAGVFVAEVEVDPETGRVALVSFTTSDDIGDVLDDAIARGQIHGGAAQGIGQAMLERTVYDADDGQLQSGSFLDYAMPRADDLPAFDTAWCPAGGDAKARSKGVGEVGAIGAPAAVVNAVADALGHQRIDMPVLPEAIWRAIGEMTPSKGESA